jgi:hypothetical protein
MRQAVRVLLEFRIAVVQNRSWDWVAQKYEVVGDQGCLRNFVATLADAVAGTATTEYQKSFLRQCLESFFIRAVGNNTRLYLTGKADPVLEALGGNMQSFDHVLTHFITSGVTQIAAPVFDQLPPESRTLLGELAWSVGEKVCDQFRARYLGKTIAGNVVTSMAQMLDVIDSDAKLKEWFLNELRQP